MLRGKMCPRKQLVDVFGRAKTVVWRPGSESNRRTRLCRPLHDHSATWPNFATPPRTIHGWFLPLHKRQDLGFSEVLPCESGAGNETRTRDPDLGKVVLYQLSYSRGRTRIMAMRQILSTPALI